mgnify:CR=1 FL=1
MVKHVILWTLKNEYSKEKKVWYNYHNREYKRIERRV